MTAFNLSTCSYGEWKPEMGSPIQTSLGRPRFQLAKIPLVGSIWEITPRREYLNADRRVFEAKYFEQLNGYGTKRLEMRFREMAEKGENEQLVLLCFERLNKGKWCHRSVFGYWWMKETGEIIDELGEPPPKFQQGALL